jgi:hypothetical protein
MEFEVLMPLQDPDQRVIIYRAIYRAADMASQTALDAIAREAEPPGSGWCNQAGSGGWSTPATGTLVIAPAGELVS